MFELVSSNETIMFDLGKVFFYPHGENSDFWISLCERRDNIFLSQ